MGARAPFDKLRVTGHGEPVEPCPHAPARHWPSQMSGYYICHGSDGKSKPWVQHAIYQYYNIKGSNISTEIGSTHLAGSEGISIKKRESETLPLFIQKLIVQVLFLRFLESNLDLSQN